VCEKSVLGVDYSTRIAYNVTAYHRQNLARAQPYVRVRDRKRSVVGRRRRLRLVYVERVRACGCESATEMRSRRPARTTTTTRRELAQSTNYEPVSPSVRDGEDGGGGGGGVGLIRSDGTTHSPSPPHGGDVLF